jgi:hypothetical protein
MKRNLLPWIYLLITFSAQSQIAYYDALELSGYYNPATRVFKSDPASLNAVGTIIKKYCTNLPDTTNWADVKDAIITDNPANPNFNPLLAPYFNVTPALGVTAFAAGKSILSSIGGLDVTTFADGLAKFLVKRTKEELYVSFFENLADEKKFPEFKILFPRTQELVENFKAWEYSNIINTLRESFDKDLKELLVNIPKFKDVDTAQYEGKVKARLRAIKSFFSGDRGKLVLSALALGQGVLSGQKLPDIIHNLAGPGYLGGILQDDVLKNSLRLLDILSMSIRSSAAGKSYISKTEFDSLAGDPVALRIFCGLVYQQIKSESIFISEIRVAERLAQNIMATINNLKAYYEELADEAEKIAAAWKALKEAKAKGELDFSEYGNAMFESLNNFLDQIQQVESLVPGLKLSGKVLNTLNTAKEVMEIAHDITVRNYSGAISATLHFITKHAENSEDMKSFTGFLVKFGSFAANVVQAKSSDEVEKAIESVVLPVGSASIKKHSGFNIAINAYVGIYGGRQRQKTDTKFVDVGGVYAPVGVTFSWGLGNPEKKEPDKYRPSSFSLFATVIDISPLVAYRFSNYNETLANDIKIRLSQVFSPGLHAAFGLPKIPLSFGGGFNWSPLLTKVEKENITVLNKDTRPFRWQLFLAVDIPLINFYTKSK